MYVDIHLHIFLFLSVTVGIVVCIEMSVCSKSVYVFVSWFVYILIKVIYKLKQYGVEVCKLNQVVNNSNNVLISHTQ